MTTTSTKHIITVEVVGDQELRNFEKQAEQLGARLRALNGQGYQKFSNSVQKSSNQMAFAMQNVGFQVQDFAVQIASGTSASRAFAQQMPQLASGFGIVGVAIGTVVAVAAALTPVLVENSDAVKAFVDSVADIGTIAAANFKLFAADMINLAKNSEVAQAALAGIATVITASLIPSIVKLSVALKAAALSNPFTTLALGATTAAVLIISNWDKVRAFIQFRIPQAWAELNAAVARAMADITRYVSSGVATMVSNLQPLVDALEWAHNRLDAIFNQSQNQIDPDAFDIGAAATENMEKFATALEQTASEYSDLAIANQEQYQAAIQAAEGNRLLITSLNGGSAGGAAGTGVGGGSGGVAGAAEDAAVSLQDLKRFIDEFRPEVEKLTEQYNNLAAAFGFFRDALTTEQIEQFAVAMAQLEAQIDGSAATIDAASNIIESNMNNAFRSIIDGSKSTSEAFDDMLTQMLVDIAAFLVSRQVTSLANMFANSLGGGMNTPIAPGPLSRSAPANSPQTPILSRNLQARIAAPEMPAAVYGVPRAATAPTMPAGTASSQSGTTVNVYNEVSGAEVNVQESSDSAGRSQIEIFVQRTVKDLFGRGGMDSTLSTAYGLRRRSV